MGPIHLVKSCKCSYVFLDGILYQVTYCNRIHMEYDADRKLEDK